MALILFITLTIIGFYFGLTLQQKTYNTLSIQETSLNYPRSNISPVTPQNNQPSQPVLSEIRLTEGPQIPIANTPLLIKLVKIVPPDPLCQSGPIGCPTLVHLVIYGPVSDQQEDINPPEVVLKLFPPKQQPGQENKTTLFGYTIELYKVENNSVFLRVTK